MQLLRKGKVKEVYAVDSETLEFVFTNHISVFDKIIPVTIPHKGETLCRTSAFWFQFVKDMGITTHFTELVSSDRMRVRRFDVITDYSKIDGGTRNYLIPLEFVMRYYAAGSLVDRYGKGEVKARDLGFPENHELRYGEKLPQPYFEVTTKFEKTDRHLTFEEARKISGISESEMDEIRKTILLIDEEIQREVGNRGLIHVDGKKEFALDRNRKIVLVDTFGTADEDRWWDLDAYSQGKIEELSKEFVRQYYRSTGYFQKLEEARANRRPEPPIPPLPDDMVKRTSDLYIDMFERITGESFN
ncbi:MAG: phosphoribosylaminoimidazolesuccinocarboxamide synthase [Thermoplasmata archaeon]|uniref:Phosphoribosylaminoimidazole-succinocarboxamide synthase n=1 Tax=Candidatus Sysuiplasma superficiale TaxID=2823368 RepID=A0A8J8CDS0_9ARCH|nr:phosphoribosylaminoimidazolesuccinocarboxamide synthase [Candidatus Sysuiplasma superficiale]MCL4346343.1 phosphoribosylaminoimidazolesuccinocarboxamide synthase [Candidatus Thermoplasmatota archaeon]